MKDGHIHAVTECSQKSDPCHCNMECIRMSSLSMRTYFNFGSDIDPTDRNRSCADVLLDKASPRELQADFFGENEYARRLHLDLIRSTGFRGEHAASFRKQSASMVAYVFGSRG